MANPARVWNYWVGGKDHFAADRVVGDKVAELLPHMAPLARLTRRFLAGTVHQLAAEYGVRQFLDIGSGLPTADNTHDVAQRVAAESRILYVDNDPVVTRHAQALLTGTPSGVTEYLDADLRDTGAILEVAERVLDFGQPVGVLLIGILHFIADPDDPYGLVKRLTDAVPPGSFLVIVHGCSDIQAEAVAESTRQYNEMSSVPYTPRSREQVTGFFDGLELLDPGVVPLEDYPLPDQPAAEDDTDGADAGDDSIADSVPGSMPDGGTSYCGVGRKR